MRFTTIDTSAWKELKKSIEEPILCMREYFGTKPEVPNCCTTETCAEYWISANERSSTIETLPYCPLSKSGINATTNVRMWKHSSQSLTTRKSNYGTGDSKQLEPHKHQAFEESLTKKQSSRKYNLRINIASHRCSFWFAQLARRLCKLAKANPVKTAKRNILRLSSDLLSCNGNAKNFATSPLERKQGLRSTVSYFTPSNGLKQIVPWLRARYINRLNQHRCLFIVAGTYSSFFR